jgi:hypothetical protein
VNMQLKDSLVEVAENAKMMFKRSTIASISTFIQKNEHCYTIPILVHKLKACAKLLLELFKHCFQGLHIHILWVPILDPRRQQMKHLTHTKFGTAKEMFVEEIV